MNSVSTVAFVAVLVLVATFLVQETHQHPSWSIVTQNNVGPINIGGHSMLRHGNGQFVFGGFDENFTSENFIFYDALWKFNVNTNRWHSLPTGPTKRAFFAAAMDDAHGIMYIHGGVFYTSDFSTFDVMADFWKYDISAEAWTEISPVGTAPEAKAVHQGGFIGGKFYVFGGINAEDQDTNDLWSYDPTTNAWTQLRIANDTSGTGPSVRDAFFLRSATINDRDTLLIAGGFETTTEVFDAELNDTWYYDIPSNTFIDKTPHTVAHNFNPPLSDSNGFTIMEAPRLRFVMYGGESPGGTGGCGSPFPNNPQNTTWFANLDVSHPRLHYHLVDHFTGSVHPPALKRSAATAKDNLFSLFGGWDWHCVDNVGGQTWNNNMYILTFPE